ncbi:uncharacterized protein BO88DRAFT_466151 [Aspergillus vadensis CBS 113365]|uniref:Uncharacterized protein n=1 Tax=Aspergillus vadensis (strain CBS 113365 / IMI 142717 / IBT 24658) TaxID=1448311 RepID=A0A319B3V4_ASPVC|nr:hypothetical protein BO88DRAFT_466151 [Aspergillus vadensis CBS 113365]PYH67015.1 hypothetical protein BO88DRAFT_466151 [Aspergillus vadensis CBS 113365]
MWSPGITLGAGEVFSHRGSFSSAYFDNKNDTRHTIPVCPIEFQRRHCLF